LRNQANRAIMPGIVAIAAALVFSAMFSYFVHLYMVRPIIRITEGIQRSVRGRTGFDVRVDTSDELADLAESIRTLAGRVDKREFPRGDGA
jgi:HAMP domain-containing protein